VAETLSGSGSLQRRQPVATRVPAHGRDLRLTSSAVALSGSRGTSPRCRTSHQRQEPDRLRPQARIASDSAMARRSLWSSRCLAPTPSAIRTIAALPLRQRRQFLTADLTPYCDSTRNRIPSRAAGRSFGSEGSATSTRPQRDGIAETTGQAIVEVSFLLRLHRFPMRRQRRRHPASRDGAAIAAPARALRQTHPVGSGAMQFTSRRSLIFSN